MRCHLDAVQPVLDLSIPPIAPVSNLTLYIMEVPWVWVTDVLPLQYATCVERVETDLPTALPLCHVNFWWPAVHRC